MRKLIMWNVITLDGCFEGEKNWDLDFHELGWGPELQQLSTEQLQSADMLVFGNVTYQGMAKHWQTAKGETAEFMNTIKKVVCSRTLEKADWNNTTIGRDAATEIRKLKQEGDKDMFVLGSGVLSASLMNAGLFDELRLCVAPVILGKGRRLFTDEIAKRSLKVNESRQLSTGGLLLKYEVLKN